MHSCDIFKILPYLDAVVACGDSPVLHLHVGWWVSKLAFSVGTRALVPLELPAYLQLEPA